jgi:homoserine O-acetyltransferase
MLTAAAALSAAALTRPDPARAQDAAAAAPGLVEKRVFEAGAYTTRGGATIPNLRVGYQTAGRLNAAGDNAVLVNHFFSGNSHAWGRVEANGPLGWWDAIIGPGRPIDTDRFFVVASDTLVNVNARDPRTVTTGPATVNPDTGRPWGMEFPVVAMRDFVEVQKRLLDHLGVRRLALVTGPSNGALNSVEWAAAYPEMIERVMPVIGGTEFDAWMIGWLDVWEAPIRNDPNWRGGDYYAQGREPPLRGLAEAWKIVTLHALDRPFLNRQFGRRPAAEGQDPARRIGDQFAVERWLDERGMARARTSDANSFLYMARANQLTLNEYPSLEAALARAPARWLVVPTATDRVFLGEAMTELVEALRKGDGRQVAIAQVTGEMGHLNGLTNIGTAAEAIRAFLAR